MDLKLATEIFKYCDREIWKQINCYEVLTNEYRAYLKSKPEIQAWDSNPFIAKAKVVQQII